MRRDARRSRALGGSTTYGPGGRGRRRGGAASREARASGRAGRGPGPSWRDRGEAGTAHLVAGLEMVLIYEGHRVAPQLCPELPPQPPPKPPNMARPASPHAPLRAPTGLLSSALLVKESSIQNERVSVLEPDSEVLTWTWTSCNTHCKSFCRWSSPLLSALRAARLSASRNTRASQWSETTGLRV